MLEATADIRSSVDAYLCIVHKNYIWNPACPGTILVSGRMCEYLSQWADVQHNHQTAVSQKNSMTEQCWILVYLASVSCMEDSHGKGPYSTLGTQSSLYSKQIKPSLAAGLWTSCSFDYGADFRYARCCRLEDYLCVFAINMTCPVWVWTTFLLLRKGSIVAQ